jgi:hypothetical protein
MMGIKRTLDGFRRTNKLHMALGRVDFGACKSHQVRTEEISGLQVCHLVLSLGIPMISLSTIDSVREE